MDDIENIEDLSKEELLKLIKKQGLSNEVKKTQEKDIDETDQCLFVPLRPKNAPRCSNDSETPYGFCKKHARTAKGKIAREAYETKLYTEELQKAQEEKERQLEEEEEAKKREEEERKLKEEEAKVKNEEKKEKMKKKGKKPEKKEKSKKKSNDPPPEPKPSEQIKSEKPRKKKSIVTKRIINVNEWDRYEDTETGLLFDTNKSVYGKQNRENGGVLPLTKDDIEICRNHGWNYLVEESESEESDEEEGSESEEEESEESENEEEELVESEEDDEDDEEESEEEESEENSDEEESEGEESEEESEEEESEEELVDSEDE